MKIVFNSEWSFLEALSEAWKAYPGGQELGVPNRTRVLEQWANVVGREKAVSEFEDLLAEYKTLKDASEALGLSLHTICKLRKSFAQCPQPHLSCLNHRPFMNCYGVFLRIIFQID